MLPMLHRNNRGLTPSGFVSTINIIITIAYRFNLSLNKNVDVNLHYDGLTGSYAFPEVSRTVQFGKDTNLFRISDRSGSIFLQQLQILTHLL